jgi:hypothetical protein
MFKRPVYKMCGGVEKVYRGEVGEIKMPAIERKL